MKRTRPMWNSCEGCYQDFQAYTYQDQCPNCKANKGQRKADKHYDHEVLVDANRILQDNGYMVNLEK